MYVPIDVRVASSELDAYGVCAILPRPERRGLPRISVISEFNEWRVLLQGPDSVVQGTRQFSEERARRHALDVARSYIHEQRHKDRAGSAAARVGSGCR
jgi:hypothetical protein